MAAANHTFKNLRQVADAVEKILAACAKQGFVRRESVPDFLQLPAEDAENLICELCDRGLLCARKSQNKVTTRGVSSAKECSREVITLGVKFYRCFAEGKAAETDRNVG